jgi:hypothetical protein
MEAKAQKATVVNGVDTDQLFKTIDLIKEKPDVAKLFGRLTTQRQRERIDQALASLANLSEPKRNGRKNAHA